MNLPFQINNSTFNMTVLITVQKAKRFITQRKTVQHYFRRKGNRRGFSASLSTISAVSI